MAPEDTPGDADAREAEDKAASEPAVTEEPSADAESPSFTDPQRELLARLERELGEGVVETADSFGTLVVRVKPESWRQAAEVSKRVLECDYLSFISGIDWHPTPREGEEAGGDTSAPVQPQEMTFGVTGSTGPLQLFAHVESTTRNWGVTFKTDVDDASPRAESWVPVYPGADWHERECWEMFGVEFDGHPSLRHLYLPSDFEGHPLRKDFALLARAVKPWPGLVDVEPMPGEEAPAGDEAAAEDASS